jgi:3-oxoacyl-[acyl-carrier protein] reductase
MNEPQGRVILTGSSGGIGGATARLFMDKGYEVYGLDIKPATVEACDFYHHYQCDIRDKSTLPPIYDVNYVIMNAGVLQKDEDPIGVNVYGTLNTEDVYVRPNLKTLKSVVILSSTAAIDGQDCREYVISKGGLLSYTKHLANQLAPWKIRVNSVTPGAGRTEMNNRHTIDPKTYDAVGNQNLMNRWGEPEESAEAIYYMAVKATFTTGANLMVDGGEMVNSRYVYAKNEEREYPIPE